MYSTEVLPILCVWLFGSRIAAAISLLGCMTCLMLINAHVEVQLQWRAISMCALANRAGA